ncbi:hypothetical protein SUGI_1178350 [Cryptomeria japonica]|uniref:jacalin-related lectin 19-like n=1 Tax=Cryptomeria japonica TaxID=3369 RepID=UPI002414C232|nr:jacalin-related lectin 19-like [Cryptomeria japonica]GLJ54871.1 hypothetical protein SUGI_1178350 [Cryptomeria japonica]
MVDYKTEGPWGGNGGGSWRDGAYSGIKSITVKHGHTVDAIKVSYYLKTDKMMDDIDLPQHGGRGGEEATILFEEDEYLKKIQGFVGNF